ncbi:uncharacterized protein LOC143497186 isoform X2 [Brachyhypopomus gauderio]
MGCHFSHVQSTEQLSVIWQRIGPGPVAEVYRLERGQQNSNFTDPWFRGRARLVMGELPNLRAVLELSQLRIGDAGTYRCIVRHQDVDYKQTKLTIWGSYTPVNKNLRRIGEEEVELSCQSQGFPLAEVVWSDGRLQSVMQGSNSTSELTSDGTLNVTSWVTVQIDVNSNYTCSFKTEDGVSQEATFDIPGEIFPETCQHCHAPAAAAVVAVVAVLTFTSLILYRRKKGKTKTKTSSEDGCISADQNLTVRSTDFLLPNIGGKSESLAFISEVLRGKEEELREVLLQRYLTHSAEVKRGFIVPQQVLDRENQCGDIRSILPRVGETVLLEGENGTGKTSVARWLASSWADSLTPDPLNTRKLNLVVLVDFNGAKGDFFQAVTSGLPVEAQLEDGHVREILLGRLDSLLILDSYKQGDREVDESLAEFLKGHRTCRVLITTCPGQWQALGGAVSTVVRLHPRLMQT